MVVKPLIPTRMFVVLEEWPCTVQFYQLLVSCWFGIWSWYPQNNGPFHKGFLQFQTKNPNQQWTIRWRRNRWITQLLPDTCAYMQNVCFVSNDQLSIKQWRTLYIYINIYFLRMHKTQKKAHTTYMLIWFGNQHSGTLLGVNGVYKWPYTWTTWFFSPL